MIRLFQLRVSASTPSCQAFGRMRWFPSSSDSIPFNRAWPLLSSCNPDDPCLSSAKPDTRRQGTLYTTRQDPPPRIRPPSRHVSARPGCRIAGLKGRSVKPSSRNDLRKPRSFTISVEPGTRKGSTSLTDLRSATSEALPRRSPATVNCTTTRIKSGEAIRAARTSPQNNTGRTRNVSYLQKSVDRSESV